MTDQGTTPPPERDPIGRDLAGKAMSAIDQVVDVVHDKVIRPFLLIGRTVAYSLIIVVALVIVAVALCVALLRLLDVYVFAAHQWASWALLGVIFLSGGLVIWRFRRQPVPRSSTPSS